jgi:hypothetical protein
VEVGHVNGREQDAAQENLIWICRSCNVLAANRMRQAGIGRLTHQYNPTKSGGAATIGEWMRAVACITPHKGAQYAGENYGLVCQMSVSDAVAMIRATPQSRRSEFASRISSTRKGRGNPMPGKKRGNPTVIWALEQKRGVTWERRVVGGDRASMRGTLKWYQENYPAEQWRMVKLKRNPGPAGSAFKRCVAAVGAKGSAHDPRAVCASAGRKKYGAKRFQEMAAAGKRRAARANPTGYFKTEEDAEHFARGIRERGGKATVGKEIHKDYTLYTVTWKKSKRNPAEAATEAFEEFHGHSPDETVEVTKQVHFHKHLAGAGQLRRLVVKGVDGQLHTISRFNGALLAFNEKKNQLFVEGGDQSINLEDFGISHPHELETLGKVIDLDYHTDKSHLGSEGGKAVYAHRFRTTNQDGQHVTVTVARYPDLIYRVLDQQLEFSGGSYTIKREGIDR